MKQYMRYHKWIIDDRSNELLSNIVLAVVCKNCGETGRFLNIFGVGCEKNRGCRGNQKGNKMPTHTKTERKKNKAARKQLKKSSKFKKK